MPVVFMKETVASELCPELVFTSVGIWFGANSSAAQHPVTAVNGLDVKSFGKIGAS